MAYKGNDRDILVSCGDVGRGLGGGGNYSREHRR